MELLEYKMDANHEGNEIVPTFVSRSDNGHFFNPSNFTYVGSRLSERVKVPDSVTVLSRADLKTRCKIAGVMMELSDPNDPESELVQMSNEDIDTLIDAFCDARDME